MSTKPTIILVPGSWHKSSCYALLTKDLNSAGYTTKPVSLPSVGASTPLENFSPDVTAIRTAITDVLSTGSDALLSVHSYSSMPAIEAIQGLEKKSSSSSKPGVSHFFFCSAFVPPVNTSLLDMLGGQPLPWFKVNDAKTVVEPDDPKTVFYGDCSDEMADEAIEELEPFSYKVFSSPSRNEGWKNVPCTYMFCEDDRAIPLEVQKGMVEGSGVKFRTVTFKSSHSPFLSRPEEMAVEIRRAAGEAI